MSCHTGRKGKPHSAHGGANWGKGTYTLEGRVHEACVAVVDEPRGQTGILLLLLPTLAFPVEILGRLLVLALEMENVDWQPDVIPPHIALSFDMLCCNTVSIKNKEIGFRDIRAL